MSFWQAMAIAFKIQAQAEIYKRLNIPMDEAALIYLSCIGVAEGYEKEHPGLWQRVGRQGPIGG